MSTEILFFFKNFSFFFDFFPGGEAPGGGMPRAGPARPMGSGAPPLSRGVGAAGPPAGSGADGRGLLSHGRAAARKGCALFKSIFLPKSLSDLFQGVCLPRFFGLNPGFF